MSYSGSNAGMETSAPWSCNGIVNNSAPLQPTHQSDAASNHSRPTLLSGRLIAQLCLRCS